MKIHKFGKFLKESVKVLHSWFTAFSWGKIVSGEQNKSYLYAILCWTTLDPPLTEPITIVTLWDYLTKQIPGAVNESCQKDFLLFFYYFNNIKIRGCDDPSVDEARSHMLFFFFKLNSRNLYKKMLFLWKKKKGKVFLVLVKLMTTNLCLSKKW